MNITLLLFIVLFGFISAPLVVTASKLVGKILGLIFLIIGAVLFAYVYNPGIFISVAGSQASNVERILADLNQLGIQAFAGFLVGMGLGLLFFFNKARQHRE